MGAMRGAAAHIESRATTSGWVRTLMPVPTNGTLFVRIAQVPRCELGANGVRTSFLGAATSWPHATATPPSGSAASQRLPVNPWKLLIWAVSAGTLSRSLLYGKPAQWAEKCSRAEGTEGSCSRSGSKRPSQKVATSRSAPSPGPSGFYCCPSSVPLGRARASREKTHGKDRQHL